MVARSQSDVTQLIVKLSEVNVSRSTTKSPLPMYCSSMLSDCEPLSEPVGPRVVC